MSLSSKPEARAEGMGFGVQQRGFPQLALRALQQGGQRDAFCWCAEWVPMFLPLKPEARAEGIGSGSTNAVSLSVRFGLRSRVRRREAFCWCAEWSP